MRPALGRVPYFFEPNQGQVSAEAQFLARAGNYALYLTRNGLAASGAGAGFRMQFAGAEPASTWSAGSKLPGISNYFLGADPGKWLRRIPNYRDVQFRSVYPGIDVTVSGEGRRIEYIFRIQPHADASAIRLAFDQPAALAPNGALSLRGPSAEFVHSAPTAFQQIHGKRVPVAARFVLADDHTATFELGEYDPRYELVIDPIINLYSFMGGSALETATACVADPTTALYLTGWTSSLEFQTAGTPFRDVNSGMRDAFISKLHPSGNFFLYSTFIGGSQSDEGVSISIDSTTNAYITGTTYSSNFPALTNAHQRNYGGNGDAFIVKMNVEGSQLTYSSFAGGSELDQGTGVASDALGFATYVGYTASPNFPTVRPNQGANGGGDDLFILKLHANAGEIVFSTYFGSDASDRAHSVALDRNGDAYIAGRTDCANLPAGARLGPLDGSDILVMKWRSDGTSASYLTCIGGNGADSGLSIAADRDGNAYVTGTTASTNFPIFLALQFAYGGALGGNVGDGFVLKLNAAGNSLLYSTYLGGVRDDWGHSIIVDSFGTAYVAGATLSFNFPSSNGVVPPSSGARSGFVTRISPQGVTLQESFFFEGIGAEDRYAVALDERGSLYVVGGALSTFQTPTSKGAPVFSFTGPVQDVFLAKLATARLQILQETYPATISVNTEIPFTQRLVNRGPDDADNVVYRGTVPAGATLIACTAQGATCLVTGNSYRIDLASLQAGRGMEINLRVRANPGLPDGTALPVGALVQSFNHDSNLADNSLVTNLFTAPAGTNCTYALPSQAVQLPATAGTFTVNVTTSFGCPWSATTGTEWTAFSSATWVLGSGSVVVNFPANPLTVPRLGSLNVAGQRVILLQQSTSSAAPYLDVPATHPFADTIRLMRYFGVTSGCNATDYCPDAVTTRGQMAVFIIRSLLGGDNFTHPAAPYFGDVPGTHPQYRHIQKMRELGITSGCTATNYCPDEPVTRAQMALFLVRARLAVGAGQSFPFPTTTPFADVPPATPAYEAVQKMREQGITSGCSATAYCPDQFTTRGQMSVFLMRAFVAP
ncbi:MAG: SBBP repeat-containing protein [Bryobacterales bacterium]|nr:SBBP repeat-containing protein [Bryobacterales bacterium]